MEYIGNLECEILLSAPMEIWYFYFRQIIGLDQEQRFRGNWNSALIEGEMKQSLQLSQTFHIVRDFLRL